jgi:hypothetical protein
VLEQARTLRALSPCRLTPGVRIAPRRHPDRVVEVVGVDRGLVTYQRPDGQRARKSEAEVLRIYVEAGG